MNLTEIVCIIDRSGSMAAVIDDAIGGFNTFLKKQQEMKDNAAIMTIALFNDKYKLLHDGDDLMKVKPFDTSSYVPDGCTALLDAVGKTMNDVNERIAKAADKEKVPSKLLYVILTDGHENSSHEFSKEQILTMIEGEKNKGREVIFLGADASAFDARFAVGSANVMAFAPTSQGTQRAYGSMMRAACSYRASGSVGNWRDPGADIFPSTPTQHKHPSRQRAVVYPAPDANGIFDVKPKGRTPKKKWQLYS